MNAKDKPQIHGVPKIGQSVGSTYIEGAWWRFFAGFGVAPRDLSLLRVMGVVHARDTHTRSLRHYNIHYSVLIWGTTGLQQKKNMDRSVILDIICIKLAFYLLCVFICLFRVLV